MHCIASIKYQDEHCTVPPQYYQYRVYFFVFFVMSFARMLLDQSFVIVFLVMEWFADDVMLENSS